MAVLHNKTQDSFTIVANTILWDTKLKLADRGLLCTICGLPDKWDFSVAGLSAILPDGRDAITHGIQRLEQKGYLKRTTTHGKDGKFSSDVEVFPMGDANGVEMSQESHDGKTVTANPLRKNRYGKTVTDNQTQYNTNNKTLKINTISSINQSFEHEAEGKTEDITHYKKIIANNIKLDWLLAAAPPEDQSETQMVMEVYSVICDMVCYPREKVKISNTFYPWSEVKERYLLLRYDHVSHVLNKIVDANLNIKNMYQYLVSTLFMETLVGRLSAEAELHDDCIKALRGKPY